MWSPCDRLVTRNSTSAPYRVPAAGDHSPVQSARLGEIGDTRGRRGSGGGEQGRDAGDGTAHAGTGGGRGRGGRGGGGGGGGGGAASGKLAAGNPDHPDPGRFEPGVGVHVPLVGDHQPTVDGQRVAAVVPLLLRRGGRIHSGADHGERADLHRLGHRLKER